MLYSYTELFRTLQRVGLVDISMIYPVGFGEVFYTISISIYVFICLV